MSEAPRHPDLGFLRRRPAGRRPATGQPAANVLDLSSLDLSGPAQPSQAQPSPVQPSPVQPSPGPASLDLSVPTPLTPSRSAAAPPTTQRGLSAPSGQRVDLGAAAPPSPTLSFLRRRPPRRAAPDLQRTGNDKLDFSADPLRGSGTGALRQRRAVPVLRGRTVLSDDRPKVVIGGEQASGGSLQFTLTWSTVPPDPRQQAAGLRRSTDMHLGCLWEMNDHSQGVLQNYQGGADAAIADGQTVLRLGGRSETEGQTLVAAVKHLSLLKRLVLFAYADSGHPEWGPLDVHLAATLKGGVLIDLPPGPAPEWATICAIASLHRVGGSLVLRREALYLNGQQESVGYCFGFSLPWVNGRSVPKARLR